MFPMPATTNGHEYAISSVCGRRYLHVLVMKNSVGRMATHHWGPHMSAERCTYGILRESQLKGWGRAHTHEE